MLAVLSPASPFLAQLHYHQITCARYVWQTTQISTRGPTAPLELVPTKSAMLCKLKIFRNFSSYSGQPRSFIPSGAKYRLLSPKSDECDAASRRQTVRGSGVFRALVSPSLVPPQERKKCFGGIRNIGWEHKIQAVACSIASYSAGNMPVSCCARHLCN